MLQYPTNADKPKDTYTAVLGAYMMTGQRSGG
jgi:hypothetical protein